MIWILFKRNSYWKCWNGDDNEQRVQWWFTGHWIWCIQSIVQWSERSGKYSLPKGDFNFFKYPKTKNTLLDR